MKEIFKYLDSSSKETQKTTSKKSYLCLSFGSLPDYNFSLKKKILTLQSYACMHTFETLKHHTIEMCSHM